MRKGPNNEDYYKIAFTHSSYATVHGLKYDYERLEFLGDAVLKMAASKYLFEKYPEYNEGFLTKIRSFLVSDNIIENARLILGL